MFDIYMYNVYYIYIYICLHMFGPGFRIHNWAPLKCKDVIWICGFEVFRLHGTL